MHVSRIILSAGIVALGAGFAQAGAIVALVPDDPGPYYGGESLLVSLIVHNEPNVEYSTPISYVRFDFTDTDPRLLLDSSAEFDFSTIPGGDIGFQEQYPSLPVAWVRNSLDCLCPDLRWALAPSGSLRLAVIGVDLPAAVGVFRMDVMNADESDPTFGAEIGEWRAFDGDITGGTLDFAVIPEPGTLTLLVFGALAVIRRRPRHIRAVGNRSGGYNRYRAFI